MVSTEASPLARSRRKKRAKAAASSLSGVAELGASVGSWPATRAVSGAGALNRIRIEHASEQEKLLTTFGVADTDYTLDAAGNPVATSKSFFNAPLPFMYVTQGLAVTYAPVPRTRTRRARRTRRWGRGASPHSGSQLANFGGGQVKYRGGSRHGQLLGRRP